MHRILHQEQRLPQEVVQLGGSLRGVCQSERHRHEGLHYVENTGYIFGPQLISNT